MNVEKLYQQKTIDPLSASDFLQNGNNLILGMCNGMPPKLIESVAAALHRNDLEKLNIYYMHGSEALANHLLVAELADKIRPRPLFLSSFDREAFKRLKHRHMIEFVPANFHQVGRLLTHQIEPDCFMVTVSPMDKHGYFSLGTNADYGATVVRKAHKVVVEVNEHMPRTFGECSVHISEIDAIIEHHTPLLETQPRASSASDTKIANFVVECINDGDTLQMGIGGVPNAVLQNLHHHKNLGLHTEMFSPAMVDLIKAGVINGRDKTLMQHKHVFTLALGNKAMYDFMDDNPSIVGFPASWVNSPRIIQKNRNMVSVNAAIEVDLTGQINAEQLAGEPFSGTGGQLDFVRGAYASQGGRTFIALHSTAQDGTISRIVPQLKGGAVTDPRMDTQYVVTEYGRVDLKGMSLQQRVKALIDIAHPDFREDLSNQAISLGLLRN